MTPIERWALRRLIEAADLRAQYLETDEGMDDDELEDINASCLIVREMLDNDKKG